MSVARAKRLARLEARRPTGPPWQDPYPAALTLWAALEAVKAGKACWLPRSEPLSEAAQAAFDATMREADAMGRRLAQEREMGG